MTTVVIKNIPQKENAMKKILFAPVVFSMLLAACTPITPVAPDDPSVKTVLYTRPESDNVYQWAELDRVAVYTQAYTLKVTVTEPLVSNTTISGAGSAFGYGGFYSGSMRIWQEGKGLLPVKVESVAPVPEASGMTELVGKTIILKTSDLKAMQLPDGATVTFVCNIDTEVLSPVTTYQSLTTDRVTHEFDDCRMTTPEYQLPK